MLIGANFLRSMKGGIRIEGDEITIYKKVTKIKTSNQTEIAEIAELEVNNSEGYIGEEPLKHWKKNGELCKLDIINPNVTIEDKPLKHVTPAMEDLFRKHVDSLLKSGAIRPSKSRHRTMAMIINSGTTIDPATGREVKGKVEDGVQLQILDVQTYKDQPLYEKTNAHGDKRLKPSDYELVRKIKEQVQNLPDLEIPPENAYIILETDGCMEGWGGIVKWKKSRRIQGVQIEYVHTQVANSSKKTQSQYDCRYQCIASNTLGEKIEDFTTLTNKEVTLRTDLMHRRNEGINSSSSLLSGGSSKVPQYLSEEYEDHLRRSHEEFPTLPPLESSQNTIFTLENRALYKCYQLKANQTPIRMDKSDAWRYVAQDLDLKQQRSS
ncbi:hypothetical protein Tco_0839125 [Tanacetum coccineum]|uniref:Uncharacterized protein n=1 Tax=Tanacetum coccineum TaxID=301880 RepID=A0ABQ5ATQ8_9ASTR